MKIISRLALFLLLPSLVFFPGCKKNGLGGHGVIDVYVKSQNNLVPGATVYIKYNAKEFPGPELSQYDDRITTGTSGPSYGFTTVQNLLKGDYYLYAIGYDSSLSATVTGGFHVKLRHAREKVVRDLNVNP